ncbi:hypothetical protein CRM22_009176 [Opisthorchis felineus]|uniref:Methyltransferase-like protein 9 n=1 Tax=Opisthorchis felineus TaxID=147828 RepID=A0A4S2L8Q2_OPIFE|nr:hypothetical protein CRM22_009176 [Opisthorchis felineus]
MGEYIRSPLIRTMHAKLQHQQVHSDSTHDEWYLIRPEYLKPELLQKFVQSEQDTETQEFLSRCFEKSDWFFTHLYHAIAKAVLTWFMTSTSINGLLRRGSMFVYSSQQFGTLLEIKTGDRLHSLLDLGAGDGMVTAKMAPYFEQVYVTELSHTMQWRLSERGFTVIDVDAWSKVPEDPESGSVCYDVVSCLNVLDRCDAPMTMLEQISRVLKPDTGRLVLGIVLPLKQYVEINADKSPSEVLEVSDSHIWEVQLNSLVNRVLKPAKFEVLRWTRVPYLCEGDFTQSFYYLNEAILVLRYRSDSRVEPQTSTS